MDNYEFLFGEAEEEAHDSVSIVYVESIRRYVFEHIETGSMLRGILENDWQKAILNMHPSFRIDELKDLTRFVLSAVPAQARGSAAAVDEWLAARAEGVTA